MFNQSSSVMRLYQNKYPISDNAKYVVDYVYQNGLGYYQLVRLVDNAILRSYLSVTDIIVDCWDLGIDRNDVAFI